MISKIIASTAQNIEINYNSNTRKDFWRWLLLFLVLNVLIVFVSFFITALLYSLGVIEANYSFEGIVSYTFFSSNMGFTFLIEVVFYYFGGLILLRNLTRKDADFNVNVLTNKRTKALLQSLGVIIAATIVNHYLERNNTLKLNNDSVEVFLEVLGTVNSTSSTLVSVVNGITVLFVFFILYKSTFSSKKTLKKSLNLKTFKVIMLGVLIYFGSVFLLRGCISYFNGLISFFAIEGGTIVRVFLIIVGCSIYVITFPFIAIGLASSLNSKSEEQNEKLERSTQKEQI
ncbi:MAG: hypothetical protein ACPGU5_04525 [Lishizhenia sp.]